MIKLAVSISLLLASVFASHHHHAKQSQWPNIKKETTFRADVTVFEWKNQRLNSNMGFKGVVKVDSERNKAVANGKVMNFVDANALVDLAAGNALISVPLLFFC